MLFRSRANGLKQIPGYTEIANARLIHKHGDYFLRIVTFIHKDDIIKEYEEKKYALPPENTTIAIDFGIDKQLTFSNGVSAQYNIQPTKRLKKLYQSFSRTKKGSRNRQKIISKIQKEYEKINSICHQKENLKAWQYIYGKKVLNTAIGGIISALKERAHTLTPVDRSFPSTKRCSVCKNIKNMRLSDRVYICDNCGNVMDRDYNAALNILYEGLSQVPVEHREFKPAETLASTLKMLEYLNSIPCLKASLVHEAGSLTALA